jgi:hypothetical protein
MDFIMVKHVKFYILAIFILLGFILDAKEDESPAYTRYVAEITRAFSKQIKKEFGFECIGNGGCMPRDVEEILIKFAAYQRANIEQARELEVKITEKFVKMINAHEKIRPFLRETPFPSSRTHVGISFYKRDNTPYMDGSVAYVSHVNSKIFYAAENPDNPFIFKDLKDEPYEEALKIVQEADKKDSQKNESS